MQPIDMILIGLPMTTATLVASVLIVMSRHSKPTREFWIFSALFVCPMAMIGGLAFATAIKRAFFANVVSSKFLGASGEIFEWHGAMPNMSENFQQLLMGLVVYSIIIMPCLLIMKKRKKIRSARR